MVYKNESEAVLPEGFDSAEDVYRSVHDDVCLILYDMDLGRFSADEALTRIREACEVASEYTAAVFDIEEKEQMRSVLSERIIAGKADPISSEERAIVSDMRLDFERKYGRSAIK